MFVPPKLSILFQWQSNVLDPVDTSLLSFLYNTECLIVQVICQNITHVICQNITHVICQNITVPNITTETYTKYNNLQYFSDHNSSWIYIPITKVTLDIHVHHNRMVQVGCKFKFYHNIFFRLYSYELGNLLQTITQFVFR
jgi:hypothetical protein